MWVSDQQEWAWPEEVVWIVGIISILALIAAVYFWARYLWDLFGRVGAANGQKSWVPMWRLKLDDGWPIRRLVSLPIAAQIAFDRLQGSTIAIAAAHDTDPIAYMATALLDAGRTQFFGASPGSTKIRPVPQKEYSRFGLSDDGRSVTWRGQDQIAYDNLHILRRDMRRRIKELGRNG